MIPRDRIDPVRHERAYPIGEQQLGSIAVNELGFDAFSTFTFLAAAPVLGQIPPFMIAYTVPERIQRAELRRFALLGHPRGTFLNNVTWTLRITQSGGQEYQQESRISGQAPRPPEDAGARWGPMGSLERPLSITLLLAQGQSLTVSFPHVLQQTAGTPFTIYTRAIGVVYS